MLDIIIPVLNEEKILTERCDYYRALKSRARLIFVDGESSDRTAEIARNYGEVLTSPPGRARQKNLGASHSTAEHLVFLNVDSLIDHQALKNVEQVLTAGYDAGCFTMRIDDVKQVFRTYESIVNFRAKRFGVLDGDLGLFITRAKFEEVGGFDAMPIMDDIAFGKKLKKCSRVNVLADVISVSSRKWHDQGFVKTLMGYLLAYLQYWTRIPFYKDKYVQG